MSYRNSGPWTLAAVVRMLLIAALVLVLVSEAHSGALPRSLCPWLAFAGTETVERADSGPLPLPFPLVFPEEARDARFHSGD